MSVSFEDYLLPVPYSRTFGELFVEDSLSAVTFRLRLLIIDAFVGPFEEQRELQ